MTPNRIFILHRRNILNLLFLSKTFDLTISRPTSYDFTPLLKWLKLNKGIHELE